MRAWRSACWISGWIFALSCGHASSPRIVRIPTTPIGPSAAPHGASRAAADHRALPPRVVEPSSPAAAAPWARPIPPPPEPIVETPDDLGARVPARAIALPDPPRGASATFSFAGNKRGWVAALPIEQLLTSAAWAGGKVFVGGGFSSRSFFGLDARTGSFEWHAQAPDGGPSSAIVTDDKVLFNTESCTLFCVEAATGRLVWKKWLGDPLMSAPAAAGGTVYAGHIVAGGGYRLSALAVADGRQIWSVPIDADVLSSPVVTQGAVYATTMRGTVYRFAASSGALAFRARIDATSAPWVTGDRLFLSRRRPQGKEQQVTLDAATGRVLATGRELDALYAASRPDSSVSAGWGYEGSRPTLAAGRAYHAMGSELRARDLETGEEVWRRRYPGEGAARGITPPAVVDGNLVIGTRAGDLFGIDVDTGLTTFAYRIGEPIAFQPIVAKGWVYATTARGRVVGLEVADPAWDGWHMWGGNASHTGPVVETVRSRGHDALGRTSPTQGTLRTERGGSRSAPTDLPLRHTRVDARISGFVSRVEVEQTFVNPGSSAVDAVYLFPLPADAAVDFLELRVGERVIRGRIQRRSEARSTFLEARRQGRLASLLEQERPDLFQQSVANIPAGATVRCVLRYAATLPYEEGRYELHFPLVAPPRYLPGEPPPRPAATRPADVDILVDVDAGAELGGVTSPSHEIELSRRDASRATVALSGRGRISNRDFVLRYELASEAPRAAVLATWRGQEGYFTLMLHPKAHPREADTAPRELVLLVDGSSSMRGASLGAAQELARGALGGLGPADTLRVIRFADRTTVLDAAALPASPANLARARTFLDSAEASGGTEMLGAIEAALEPARDRSRLRVVLLLTDGWVGNEDQILGSIAASLGGARLFAVGVGAAPNRYLLERAAELGRGDVQLVGPSDDPANASARLAARIARPLLTDVEVDWGELPVRDVYPRVVPDLWADRPILLHGKFDRGGSGTIQLRGRTGSWGQPWSTSIEATLPRTPIGHEALASVWARARVHDLETATFLRSSPELLDQIALTGLEHGLVTSETSFVAADEATPIDRPRLSVVPPAEGEPLFTTAISVPTTSSPVAIETLAISGSTREAFVGGDGIIDSSIVTRVVRANLAQIRAAYQRGLRSRPGLRGRLSVVITVGPNGRVTSVSIDENTLGDLEVEQRILEAVRRWVFPPPEGGTVTLRYPFVFDPGG